MPRRTLRGLLALFAAAVLACSSAAPPGDEQDIAVPLPVPTSPDVGAAVVDLTNAERAKGGLSPLAADDRLMRAAQIHSEQLAQVGRLDHVVPNARYPRPEHRLTAVSYKWQAFAENVALGQRTPAAAVAEWMQSAGHRANIMNPTYTEMGVGYARDSGGRPYWVQVFGKPLP